VTPLAALSAAALLAGLSASPFGAAPAPSGDVVWRAGQAVWNGQSGNYELSGDVVVQRGGVVLRARRATVNPGTGEVWAHGDVLLLDGTRAVSAGDLHAVLDGPFEASDVVAFLKEQPFDPVRIASAAEARHGRNRLAFRADAVEGEGEGEDRLRLRGVEFTACDCGETRAPSWAFSAPRAEVEGSRVYLHRAVLRIAFFGAVPPGQRRWAGYEDGLLDHPVPVLFAPWLSLPLSDRQTGLLFPELGRTAVTGFHLGVPAYVTLGRSADLTATPQYFFGARNPDNAGGAVKGPGAKLELRWAPAARAQGQVLLHLVDDLDRERLTSGQRGGGGLRLSLEGAHAQDLSPSTRLGAHLALSQDPFMFRDFRAPGLPGDAYYARSDALVSHRAERWVIEGGAAYYQPLEPGDRPRPPGGWFGAGAPKLQRWPSVAATLLPGPLGPFEVEGRLGLSRWAPLQGHRGELLATDPAANAWDSARPETPREGVYVTAPGTADEVVHSIPREAASRADARLQLAAPLLLGRWLSLEPFVRGAGLGYLFDAGRDPTAAAWGLAGASASVELLRRYGALEHRIVPRLELVAGTSTWRAEPGDPFPAYDLWDRVEPGRAVAVAGTTAPLPLAQKLSAAPDGAYVQLRGSLRNQLDAGPAGRLMVELGQDADLRRGRLAETFAALSASKGFLTADASGRVLAFGDRPPRTAGWASSWLDGFTRLHVGAAAHDPRGDQVRLALDATGSGAVGAQNAGVDALFDLRPSGAPPEAWYRGGARLVLGAARLDYEARLTARTVPTLQCGAGSTHTKVKPLRVVDQKAELVWDSPCHCFTASVSVGEDICGSWSYGLSIDLSKAFQGGAAKAR
jgi:LPS-assembly protein